jgi:hypothetical protein
VAIKIALLDVTGQALRKKIGFLELDCVISEDITMSNSVTQSPIETGESISDHVYNDPLQLRLEAIISDSDPQRQERQQLTNSPTVSARLEAYEALRDLWRAKQPVDVVTGLETFTNMVVTNISIPRENADGDSIKFNVDLIQVEIKESVFQKDKRKRSNVGRKQGTIANESLVNKASGTLEQLTALRGA